MKNSIIRIFVVLQLLHVAAFAASNSVVNLSHYDLMRVDFERMKAEGIVGVIHEASYPRFERDAYYHQRHSAAARAGLLWGAYHFGDATDPIRQADHFLRVVGSSMSYSGSDGVLLVLDFEKNGHYPGRSMRVDQAAAFVERIRQRTGHYPGVYMSEYRIRQMLGNPRVSATDKRSLIDCWLWVANYHFMPRNIAPWDDWRMWQYTGDGKCDLPRSTHPRSVANIAKAERNMFRGDRSDVASFWREHSWKTVE